MSAVERMPVLAVCGWSGSGKTTLLEALIPLLRERGLRVAVVKNDAHGVEVDRPGKDSDRLFRAGASVVLRSPGESFARWHGEVVPDLPVLIRELAARNDVVLVEGHKSTTLKKIWLLGADESEPPDGLEHVVRVLPRDEDLVGAALQEVVEQVEAVCRNRMVLGGVLIGGRSQRMGREKQLLEYGGRSLVENTVAALEGQVDEVVLLGGGTVPSTLSERPVLPDPRGMEGPMSGLIAALRWAPDAAWVMVSCDLPHLTSQGVRWLLGQRQPGRWAILPTGASGVVNPLFAVYEPQALPLLEELILSGSVAPRRLAVNPRVSCPTLPQALEHEWRGVNTPDEYREVCGGGGDSELE